MSQACVDLGALGPVETIHTTCVVLPGTLEASWSPMKLLGLFFGPWAIFVDSFWVPRFAVSAKL
jgi:hypothetical protein